MPECGDVVNSFKENELTSQILTVKASSWPLKTQMPEMLLSLLPPNKRTLAKAFFRSLSRRWNIPVKSRQFNQ